MRDSVLGLKGRGLLNATSDVDDAMPFWVALAPDFQNAMHAEIVLYVLLASPWVPFCNLSSLDLEQHLDIDLSISGSASYHTCSFTRTNESVASITFCNYIPLLR